MKKHSLLLYRFIKKNVDTTSFGAPELLYT